jgi:hypothetical protein
MAIIGPITFAGESNGTDLSTIGWIADVGVITVEGETAEPSATADAESRYRYGTALDGPDQDLSATFTDTTNNAMSLIARQASSVQTYLELYYDGEWQGANSYAIRKLVSGVMTVLDGLEDENWGSTPWEMTFTVDGNDKSATIHGGHPLFEDTDSSVTAGNYIGIGSGYNRTGNFDNIGAVDIGVGADIKKQIIQAYMRTNN